MELKGISVEVLALTASFRDPVGQLYHETLPLPPPTTLVGLAGAALGENIENTLLYFKQNQIAVGCIGSHKGQGSDLWNYSKVKAGGKKDKDIVVRNFLFGFRGVIYYACKAEEIMRELHAAFHEPYYSLTLSTSDELIKINKIDWHDEIRQLDHKDLINTWICDDQSENIELNWDKVKATPITQTVSPHLIKKLPTDYSFDNKGARRGEGYQNFTFLGPLQQLIQSVPVYLFRDIPVSCFKFNKGVL